MSSVRICEKFMICVSHRHTESVLSINHWHHITRIKD